MTVATSLIPGLDEIVRHGDPARRAEAAQRIAELFLQTAGSLRSNHVDMFDGLLVDLVPHAEIGARADLAERLSIIANAPRLLVGQLASEDELSIAGPLLRRSPVIDEAGIPRVTYCEPEVASVGLTEAQAKEAYGEVQTLTYDLAGNGKSQILQTQGAIKLVKAGGEGTPGPVVGIHMVGARVGELIGEAQLIYNWDAQAEDVAALIHAHPTQTEAVGEAHLALAGKPLHSHS